MWNWREYYQLVEQIRTYARVLYRGESLVQIPQEESMGEPMMLHTISGIFYGDGRKPFFGGYDPGKASVGRMVWLYLKKLPEGKNVLFNVVFLQYGGKRQGVRQRHGMRMVYRCMAGPEAMSPGICETEIMGRKQEIFSLEDSFQKLVVIGRKDAELRKATVEELLEVFGKAADERGMLLLAEQNARMLCGGNGNGEKLQQNMG